MRGGGLRIQATGPAREQPAPGPAESSRVLLGARLAPLPLRVGGQAQVSPLASVPPAHLPCPCC